MAAVDTNVVIRLLVSDDESQQRTARRRLDRLAAANEPVFVSTLVLAEVTWVLSSVYEYGREAQAEAVRALLETPPFVVDAAPSVRRALGWFEGGSAEFSDYLAAALADAVGQAPLFTFDRKLAQHPFCQRP